MYIKTSATRKRIKDAKKRIGKEALEALDKKVEQLIDVAIASSEKKTLTVEEISAITV